MPQPSFTTGLGTSPRKPSPALMFGRSSKVFSRPAAFEHMPATSPPSQIRRYQEWLRRNYGLAFEDYAALWRWSITDLDTFWRSIWQYHQIQTSTPFECALCIDRMPGAVWFKGATVN